MLIKPLLEAFIVVPLVRRRWRSLALTPLPAAALLALAILLAPGGHDFFSTARYVAGGSNLHGRYVFYSLSLRGLAERFGVGTIGVAMRTGVAVAAVALLGIWSRQNRERGTAAAMATALLLAFMLAGPLSEAHYLLVACPCLLFVLALRPRFGLLALAAPGFALMIVPRYYFGDVASAPGSLQIRYFLVEVLFFVTAAAAALTERSGTRAPRTVRRSVAIRSARSG